MSSFSGHFIKYCFVCKTVMAQCRCMDCTKTVEFGVCDECKNKDKVNPDKLTPVEAKMFILKESVMNGTVTMEVFVTGIKADTFEQAIEKVKSLKNFSAAVIKSETNECFEFTISNETFPTWGCLKNEPLKII